jgi:uncharacterized protein YqgC (DUF456 family)
MLWVLAGLLIIVGLCGTVLPGLPGPILVFAGLLVAAWADDFARIGVWTLVLLGIMTVTAHGVDLVSSALGVRRVGASGRAVVGAAMGALAGLFFGVPGVLIGPFIGAVAGELTVRRDLRHAGRAGVAAWIGFIVGNIVKLAVVVAMLAVAAAVFVIF